MSKLVDIISNAIASGHSYLEFIDPLTGQIVRGISKVPVPKSHALLTVKVEAFEPCKLHAPNPCNCEKHFFKRVFKRRTGMYFGRTNMGLKQLAQFIQLNILASGQTITNTAGTGVALTANTATSSPTIVAGTGTTAAAFTDFKLTTPVSGTSGSVAGTVNAVSGNSFTVTGTITNSSGSTINYSEVGLQITAGSNTYLLAHDVFSALSVSNNGTLQVTYTLSFS